MTRPRLAQNLAAVPGLFAQFVEIAQQLPKLGVLRTSNNPAGDYAEWLAEWVLGGTRQNSSARGFDIEGKDKKRYEVKAIRRNAKGRAVQFSALRGLDERTFDSFIGVVFARNFSVEHALKVPWATVNHLAGPPIKRTGSRTLLYNQKLWTGAGVEDITKKFQAKIARLNSGTGFGGRA